jgi:maleylpyruvate isomerase
MPANSDPRLTRAGAAATLRRPMIRLHLIPYSTNVERVALALAHKGLDAEAVEHADDDRAAVRELSGQDLVPVIEHDGRVIADSPAILEYLEELQPEPRLYPADPARAAEMRIFVDWFNRVWKRAPNTITFELMGDAPDERKIERHAARLAASLDRFEALLSGRDYLFGDELSAADVVVFPFVKYAARLDPADHYLFHRVLHERMPLGDGHPRLAAWIDRIDRLPRTPAV